MEITWCSWPCPCWQLFFLSAFRRAFLCLARSLPLSLSLTSSLLSLLSSSAPALLEAEAATAWCTQRQEPFTQRRPLPEPPRWGWSFSCYYTVVASSRITVHHSLHTDSRPLPLPRHLFPYGNFHEGFKYPWESREFEALPYLQLIMQQAGKQAAKRCVCVCTCLCFLWWVNLSDTKWWLAPRLLPSQALQITGLRGSSEVRVSLDQALHDQRTHSIARMGIVDI